MHTCQNLPSKITRLTDGTRQESKCPNWLRCKCVSESRGKHTIPRRGLFQEHYDLLQRQPRLEFAEPGGERQDSVYNGFQVKIRQEQIRPSNQAIFGTRLPAFAKCLAKNEESQFEFCPYVQAISKGAALVAIHDSARPLVSAEDTRACIQDAIEVGYLIFIETLLICLR